MQYIFLFKNLIFYNIICDMQVNFYIVVYTCKNMNKHN